MTANHDMIESGRDARHPIIRSGELVDLYDEGGIVCAVVLGEEKGRLRVVTERGKEMRVAPSRVALRTGETVALPSAAGAQAGAAAAAAARHAQAAAGRRSEIDLAALWDVLVDEPQRHTLAGLASLALGSDDGVARSALARALQEDRTTSRARRTTSSPARASTSTTRSDARPRRRPGRSAGRSSSSGRVRRCGTAPCRVRVRPRRCRIRTGTTSRSWWSWPSWATRPPRAGRR